MKATVYRKNAEDCRARAGKEDKAEDKERWLALAEAWFALAEATDKRRNKIEGAAAISDQRFGDS